MKQPSTSTDNQKFIFTGEHQESDGNTVWRIRRRDSVVLGGWLAGEGNLSADGSCWVADNAIVSGGARVGGSAQVYGDAVVYGGYVGGNAAVFGDAEIHGGTIEGNARVHGEAVIYGELIYGNAEVCGSAWVFSSAKIYENCIVRGGDISGDVVIRGVAEINSGKLKEGEYTAGVYDQGESPYESLESLAEKIQNHNNRVGTWGTGSSSEEGHKHQEDLRGIQAKRENVIEVKFSKK